MSWMASVDAYCERGAPGFAGEPFNSLTGLAFLLVGGVMAARAPTADDRNAGLALALVGCVSALSHAVGIRLTSAIDLAANLGYLLLLGTLLLRRLAGQGRPLALAGAAAAVALAFSVVTSPGTGALLGPLADLFVAQALLLLLLALVLVRRHRRTALGLAAASAILGVGLPFRMLDAALCPVWPAGTHGVWHLMNAASAAILLASLARHGVTDGPRLAQRRSGR